jgi:formate-nitrite transporter family protein
MADKTERELQPSEALATEERQKAREISAHAAPVVFEAIRLAGENELSRPAFSLFWSGVAAGFGISTAVMCKGFFVAALPAAAWTPAVSNLGYAVGFLVVILGRLQLFTENTVTPILPLLSAPSRQKLLATARLWSIVFLANMIGCLIAAFFIARAGILPPQQMEGVLEVCRHLAAATAMNHLTWGAPAGFMIAALVWVLPTAEGAGKFLAVLVMTYMIGLGGLSHVVAGATELFILLWLGEIGAFHAIVGGILPALVGNVVGGTFLFAALAYAQVKEEV